MYRLRGRRETHNATGTDIKASPPPPPPPPRSSGRHGLCSRRVDTRLAVLNISVSNRGNGATAPGGEGVSLQSRHAVVYVVSVFRPDDEVVHCPDSGDPYPIMWVFSTWR